jgi:hypothetical protein
VSFADMSSTRLDEVCRFEWCAVAKSRHAALLLLSDAGVRTAAGGDDRIHAKL